MADEQARLKADRIKALLAGYYGGGDSTGGSAGAGASADAGVKGAVKPVNAPSENPEEVQVASMLRTYPLERLLVEHRSMARDIKNLDSDMQQLVYENYNKFISATDTIRAMKSSVDGMGTDMDKLKSVMDNVSDKTNAVCKKLQGRRESMEELQKIQSVLKKLQAVFDLPKKMRAALEGDMLETAVSFYAEAQPLLQKYGNRGTFRQISSDSDLVAREISQLLKRRLTERKDSEEQCVLLLRKLGEPDDTLQDKYLQGRANRLRRILREASVVVDAMAVSASSLAASAAFPGFHTMGEVASGLASTSSPLLANILCEALLSRGVEQPLSWAFTAPSSAATVAAGSHLAPGTLLQPPNLKQFVRILDEKVINAMQETVVNVLRFFLQGDAQSPVKRRSLVSLSREVFGEYFKIIKRALADWIAVSVHGAASIAASSQAMTAAGIGPTQGGSLLNPEIMQGLSFGEDWGTEALVQALSALSADLGLLHAHLPELALKDRAVALVSGCIEIHLSASFGAVSSRVVGGVLAVRSRLESASGVGADEQLLKKGYVYCSDVIQQGLSAVMASLKPYDSNTGVRLMGTWREGYVDIVQGRLQHLFLALLSAFMDIAKLRYDGSDLLRAALKPPSEASRSIINQGPDGMTDGFEGPDAFSNASEALELPGSSSLIRSKMELARCMAEATAGEAAGSALQDTRNSTGSAKTGLLLMLAKLASYMEQTSVPWVMETLAASPALSQQQRFAAAAPSASSIAGSVAVGELLPPAFVPGEVARRLNAASAALLESFVEMHGRQLSVMVRRSVASTNWLNHREPRGPRPVCDLQLERLGKAETEVMQLVDDSGRGRTDDRRRGGVGAGGLDANLALETGNVERNLAKIFREKVKVFGAVQFTQAHILAAITGIGLKSLVECVRLATLGRAGLQQLQLDCHSLKPPLRRLTGGSGATAQMVESLLDEVVAAGVERCIEPSLLEPPVLDRILSSVDV
ncbi:hypothetical protein CEUSTIGMA_g5279.t1 [Chlamydomonas eustigma]|uniref:Vacuolar protein sorting-associated protein 51 homolog n=1 Tax=Chlamydomonas eustigma TaxID=1157962 RepID=A0A250X432_9CHLO|nr:hypothetical protein CEUSTIGMA_g5279.t1 [Chlamydomonas eustigma]|eukprot:GAX77837.1 hypothetical protein CEUSTIGMA_g5279.t1 [Chlamydomonas eustigma]